MCVEWISVVCVVCEGMGFVWTHNKSPSLRVRACVCRGRRTLAVQHGMSVLTVY